MCRTGSLPEHGQRSGRDQAPGRAAPAAAAVQKASLLGGKLAFTIPAGYVQGEMPEIDAKAKAQGVTGALYTNAAEKRVLIVTETPMPMGVQASDNDGVVLDGLVTGILAQQSTGYKDFKSWVTRRSSRRTVWVYGSWIPPRP